MIDTIIALEESTKKAKNTGFPPKQSGSMGQGPGVRRGFVTATTRMGWLNMPGIGTIPENVPIRLERRNPIHGVFTTCTGMCMNGAGIGMGIILQVL